MDAETFSAIANSLTALAAAVAAIAAAAGLSIWRSELATRRKLEIAEQALGKLYQAQQIISDASSGYSDYLDIDEVTRLFSGPGRPDVTSPGVAKAAVCYQILKRNRATFTDLQVIAVKAKIMFGDEAANPLKKAVSIQSLVFFAAQKVMNPNVVHSGEDLEVFSDGKMNFEYLQQLNEAVEEAEKLFKPVIRLALK